MAEVQVTKGETIVSLTLTEEEALYVLGVLGHSTGVVPEVYRDLFKALRAAGYEPLVLREASDKYKVLVQA